MFLGNSPNPQFPPIRQYHWFDGNGMIHGVQIKDGLASYCNPYVRTPGFQMEQEAGKAIWSGILEPPQQDVSDLMSVSEAGLRLSVLFL